MLTFLHKDERSAKPVSRAAGNSDSKKRLAWMITSPPAAPVKMTITPELATEMLIYNTDNRPVSAGAVKHYAEQMKAGQWRDTFMPIQFSDKGRLIDGQHRLQALVDSGVAIAMWVAFGAKDETFAFIDIGKKRTAGDIFAINNVKNWTMVSAATKWIWAYEMQRHSPRDGGPGISSSKTNMSDPAPLYEYYTTLDVERLQDSVRAGQWFAQRRMPNPSIACAIHYLCAGKSRAVADAFFEKVATGVGIASTKEAAWKLRDRLTDAKRPITRGEQAVYTIQSWNALRRGRAVGSFDWRGGPLPRVA